MEIKDRMEALGVTQVEMMLELQKRGMNVSPPMMSQILRGVYNFPKGQKVLTVCEDILAEYERITSV